MASHPRCYEFGAFRLDAVEKALYAEGQPVALTPKAIETLIALVERHGHLVTKEQLLKKVWPDAFVEENNLAQNISQLRRLLAEGGSGGRFIETVPTRGYRFVAVVRKLNENTPAEPTSNAQRLQDPITTGDPASPPDQPRRTRAWQLWALAAAASLAVFATSMVREKTAPARELSASAADTTPDARARASITRIAVLPFLNLGSPGDEYFAAGITEEIHSRLAALNGLAVPSTMTMAAYDRSGKSMRDVGADLGVHYLLEGTVRWWSATQGGRVKITPKLVRVADDTTIWTHQYDASLANLFSVQAEISLQIAAALQVALDARERRAVEARSTVDTDAYMAFLRGIAAYQAGYSDTTNQSQAREALEHAVARDPKFALAWSWLARTYTAQYRSGADRTSDTRDAAYRSAQTAIALDGGLPEGHLALGQALYGDREYSAARRELEIARVGLPNSTELWQLLAHVEQAEGRWMAARAAFMRAFELDPAATAQWLTVHYLHLRDYSQARRFIGIARAANKVTSVVPDAWLRFSEGGDLAAARPVLEAALGTRSPADARVRGFLARLEWLDGRHERALDLIDGMDAAGAWMPANFRFPAAAAAGQVYEKMGRHEDALRSYAAALPDLRTRERHSPDDYQVQAALALTMLGLRRPSEALQHAQRAAKLLPVSKDAVEGPLYLYLLAQVQAQSGNPAAAFATLDAMFEVPGFYNEYWVQRDPGFAALWRHPLFRERIARWAMQRGDLLVENNRQADATRRR